MSSGETALDALAERAGELAPKSDESYPGVIDRLVGATMVGPSVPHVEISAYAFEQVKMLAWKAAPYGETEDGDIASYIIPKGVLHRLVGAMQACGYSVSLRAYGSEVPGEQR